MEQFASFCLPKFSELGSSPVPLVVALLATLRRDPYAGKRIPPGSLGLPLLHESWSFVRAQGVNQGAEWIRSPVSKYGPIFRTSLMGKPTVVITGQAGNKFVFAARDDVLSSKQPPSISRISGKHGLFGLFGDRYKRVKGAMMGFLKAESLQNSITQMEDLVKTQLQNEIEGKTTVKAVWFMKRLTFEVACSLLFALRDEPTKEALFDDFTVAFRGVRSVPLNVPGTAYWHALRARWRIVRRLLPVERRRREELKKGTVAADSDVVACLLALRDENEEPMGDDAITDNMVALMLASHDTSAIRLSLMVWKLARDGRVCDRVSEGKSSNYHGLEDRSW